MDADRVSNALLREAFLASGMTATALARHLGWRRPSSQRPSPKADEGEVRRVLGLKAVPCQGGKKRYHVKTLTYENALAIAGVLGLDPVDVGL